MAAAPSRPHIIGLFLPWSAQKLRGEIFASCAVLEERAGAEGATLRVRGEPEVLQRLKAKR